MFPDGHDSNYTTCVHARLTGCTHPYSSSFFSYIARKFCPLKHTWSLLPSLGKREKKIPGARALSAGTGGKLLAHARPRNITKYCILLFWCLALSVEDICRLQSLRASSDRSSQLVVKSWGEECSLLPPIECVLTCVCLLLLLSSFLCLLEINRNVKSAFCD